MIRTILTGFNLRAFDKVFGSGDAIFLGKALDSWFRLAAKDPWGTMDESTVADGRDALTAAVNKGIPIPGLKAERDGHILAVQMLIHSQKHKHADFEGNDLALHAFWEEATKPLIASESDPLVHFKYLSAYGRPILAPKFKPKQCFTYGYLTMAEAKSLVSALQSTEFDTDVVTELDCAGLIDDLCDSLSLLIKKKCDVWVERS